MKPYQLKALVAIADHGSIRAAARVLSLTQPAVSKAIQELETTVGMALLIRQRRGVLLTDEGRVLLGRARMIVREIERAQEEIQILKGKGNGRLNIGVSPLAGLTVLPQAFLLFRKKWPDIQLNFLEFSSDQLYDNLENGNLDFAVGARSENRAPRRGDIELASLPTSFAVRHGSQYADSRNLAELQELEWLHTDITGNFNLFIGELFIRKGLEPPRRITRCSSQALFYSLSMTSDVVIFWSQLSLGSPILSKQFQSLDIGEELPHLKLNLMLRQDGLMTKAGEYFLECIRHIALQEVEKMRSELVMRVNQQL